MHIERRGIIFVIAAPSGGGKTSVAKEITATERKLHPSISMTTRDQRPGEEEGVHYFFTDEASFKKAIDEDHFLEYANAFGNYYGTPKKYVEDHIYNGRDVVLDIEWQGMHRTKELYGDDVVTIFLLPPSMKILRNRLLARNQDSEDIVDFRMKQNIDEIQKYEHFDYIIINDDFDKSVSSAKAIIRAERLKKWRLSNINDIVQGLIKE